MPLYGYRCPVCGNTWEDFIHSISKVDQTISACVGCGGRGVRLLNSGVRHQIATGDFFEPYMEENLGLEPVWIDSVEKLRRECSRRGLGCKKMPPKVVDNKP